MPNTSSSLNAAMALRNTGLRPGMPGFGYYMRQMTGLGDSISDPPIGTADPGNYGPNVDWNMPYNSGSGSPSEVPAYRFNQGPRELPPTGPNFPYGTNPQGVPYAGGPYGNNAQGVPYAGQVEGPQFSGNPANDWRQNAQQHPNWFNRIMQVVRGQGPSGFSSPNLSQDRMGHVSGYRNSPIFHTGFATNATGNYSQPGFNYDAFMTNVLLAKHKV